MNSKIITLRLTFGGAPCPYEWGVISETICDLANELIKCDDWDPLTLHASVQQPYIVIGPFKTIIIP